MLQGSPGLGKTSTIVAVLGRMGLSTLRCAPTNVAVREVALSLMQRVATPASQNASSLLSFPLSSPPLQLRDIILFTSTLDEDSPLQPIWCTACAARVQAAAALPLEPRRLTQLLLGAEEMHASMLEVNRLAAEAAVAREVQAGVDAASGQAGQEPSKLLACPSSSPTVTATHLPLQQLWHVMLY